MEETVTISNRELSDYVTLGRKRSETEFRRNFLVRNGASIEDYHVKALTESAADLEKKIAPIKRKLESADILLFSLHAAEIARLNEEIDSHSNEERETAIVQKEGPVFEKMKRRGWLSRQNFDRKEDVARLTIMLNGMPRADAEGIALMLESGKGGSVDVSHLERERQQELVNLTSRLGFPTYALDGILTSGEKPASGIMPQEEARRRINGRSVWIPKEKLESVDENERILSEVGGQIQAMTAKHTVEEFSVEGQEKFDSLQQQYLEGLKMRNVYLTSADPLEEVAVPLKKESVNEAKMKS